ncbi:MAG: FKBP-type peptidyl-prolyl cis-trans isomerase, partial [Cyanobium sp.]
MRDILISSAVFLACLMVAFVSQLVAPTPMVAAAPTEASAIATTRSAVTAPQALRAAVGAPFELDPTDPNPFLFTMAPETPSTNADQLAAAASLGGELNAPKERVTPSGLRITDLELGTGAEAIAGPSVSVNYRGSLSNGKEFDSSYGRG